MSSTLTIDEAIARSQDTANLCRETFPDATEEHEQMARWLSEAKLVEQHKISPKGISIGILTYNVLFYTKLQLQQIRKHTRHTQYEIIVFDNGSTDGTVEFLKEQPDVRLGWEPGNSHRHGPVLNWCLKQASYPVFCTLCSDAFPVHDEWIVPSLHLSSEVVLAGVSRGYGRIVKDYVCPSYLFGWTDWLKTTSFEDKWPEWDTGELCTKSALDQGRQIRTWPKKVVDFGGDMMSYPCDYSGLVWHTWFSGRVNTSRGVRGLECGERYHEVVQEYLRKRFNLDF